MHYSPLGSTGLNVSEIGFGAWAIGGNAHGNSYGATDDATSIAAIHAALESGCNFIDSADVYGYGHSEEVIGAALDGLAELPLIATKVGGNFYGGATRLDFSSDYLPFACEQSLKRLGIERIDLYQLHNPSAQMIHQGEVIDTLQQLKHAGKIGHIGVSVFTPEEAFACLDDPRIEAIQLVYNLLSRNMEGPVFARALEQGVGIIAREPLHNSFLAGQRSATTEFEPGDIRYGMPSGYKGQLSDATQMVAEVLKSVGGTDASLAQFALRFAISQPAVSCAIPGIKTPEQARENMAASDLGPLPSEMLTALFGPSYPLPDSARRTRLSPTEQR